VFIKVSQALQQMFQFLLR